MIDIAILSLPKLQIRGPLLAAGQLKAALNKAGFKSWTSDFNLWLHQKTSNSNIWNDLDNTLIEKDLLEPHYEYFTNFIVSYINEELLPKQPKVVGITMFSLWTFPFAELFLSVLRDMYPGTILLGGPALTNNDNKILDYMNKLKDKNLYDDFISGDADISIVEYMKGNLNFPGINNYSYDNNFNRTQLEYPNFDDFKLNEYEKGRSIIPISGSRGCVRACAFCNVPLLWNKFTSKDGDRIAKEIIYLNEKYNVNLFRFVDSLVNGNQKVFFELISILSDYNKGKNKIGWTGQFIVREVKNTNELMFDLIKQSGCNSLQIGIESGSYKVRKEIKKNFTNQSIEYYLQQFDRVGQENIVPLMLVGFPTETEIDFQETLDILDMFSKYKCINNISSEHPMAVLEGTPVHLHMDNYDITNYQDYFNWESKHNTFKTRIERYYKFIDKASKLKLFPQSLTGVSNILVKTYNSLENKDKEVVKIIERFHG